MYGLPGVIAFKGYPNIEAYELLFGPLEDTTQYVMTKQDLEDVVSKRCGPWVWHALQTDVEAEQDSESELDSLYEEMRFWEDTAREAAEALKELSASIRERKKFTASAKEKIIKDIEDTITILEKEL
ncbi:hypothetical protein SAMN04515656_104120 [Eubacterium aggregans]|uniref:Uncharacterized protein n=1 Tax=Eubacterium aggregans TaxID=81409 RepID=A0A1H3YUI4_9FIRM|nr:hypothetical protein [Eubacterium aggregans]SEA15213.1 hypothetical protein SAMN04515656_104120 [Eubacterium aggregans]